MDSPIYHSRLASRVAFQESLANPRFATLIDKVSDFFTGLFKKEIKEDLPSEEPTGDPAVDEQVKKLESKFENQIRSMVDETIMSIFEIEYTAQQIKSIDTGGKIPPENLKKLQKKGQNLLNFSHSYFKFLLGHGLEPSGKDFGLSSEEAKRQAEIVKEKLGVEAPIKLDVGHLKKEKAKSKFPEERRGAPPKYGTSMSDVISVASRIAAEDILDTPAEYSCHIELSMTATFSGSVSESALVERIKEELKASIQTGMGTVATDFSLSSVEVKVLPISIECAVVDESDLSDIESGDAEPFGDSEDYEEPASEEEEEEEQEEPSTDEESSEDETLDYMVDDEEKEEQD